MPLGDAGGSVACGTVMRILCAETQVLNSFASADGVISMDNPSMAQLENFRLKVFRIVAEHLNFHKAAEHLFLTQPAVTLQIKALEQDLGVRLFDPGRGRMFLTVQGWTSLDCATR